MRRPRVRERRQSKLVLTEAEELLRGRAARPDSGGQVPTWALVNFLAHADGKSLARTAKRASRARLGAWDEAVACLARELVQLEVAGTGIAEAQHEVLVPLELDLLAGRRRPPRSADNLVRMVHDTLEEHRPRT